MLSIGLSFLCIIAACNSKKQVPEPVEWPSSELSAIDSLMWSQPDSALLRLLPWFDTCCRDAARHISTATAYNRHYANLLLSELLYKNYYPQTNRTELQQALAYFDSLTMLADTRGVSLQPRPRRDARRAFAQNIAFLDARAHYINGVGLSNMEDLESDMEIISIYLEEGDSTNAFALANMLPTLYGFTNEDLTDHNNYLSMLNLYYQLYQEERNTMMLDSVERATVEYLADNGTGRAQAMAQAIMMGAYGYHYNDCPSGVELVSIRDMNTNMPISDFNTNEAMGLTIEASPNPANTWVAVNYTLPAGFAKAQMKLVNTFGEIVATYDLLDNEGQKVLDLRGLSSGVYTYTVYCGNFSQSGKLVIVK